MDNYFALFKKYNDFSGRSPRKEFWLFNFFTILTLIFVSAFFGVTIGILASVFGFSEIFASSLGVIVSCILLIFFLIPIIAVSVRRLHDINHSGWWLLLNFVPFIGGIILFVFFVTDSENGENRYGKNPKEAEIKSI